MDDTQPRTCARCRRVLPVAQFPCAARTAPNATATAATARPPINASGTSANRARHIANVAVIRKRVLVEQRAIVNECKRQPCADCGLPYPPYVMDFDHVRGVKVAEIGRMKGKVPTATLLEEISKCDVVCANCHRIRTHRRRTER